MTTLKTVQEFLDLVGDTRKEITLTTYTAPKLKKDCPFVDVMKVNILKVAVNFNYTSDVNKQRMAEGKDLDFIPKARVWGTRVGKSSLFEHKGEKYIETEVLSKERTYYIDKNRKMLTEDQLKPYLPEHKSSGHQGVDTAIIINLYKAANIKEAVIDGVMYACQF